jgi:hypothetical protein
VVFDSWYSSLDNLKLIRRYEWIWLTRFKRNRHVNPDGKGNRTGSEVDITATGSVVHLKGYGLVKVFKIVTPNGDIDALNVLPEVSSGRTLTTGRPMTSTWGSYNGCNWLSSPGQLRSTTLGLKQCCGAERAQVRSSRAQHNHIGLSIRAFLRLELNWFATGISWYEAKLGSVRDAVRAYLAAPRFSLAPTA